jgi:hypothetical protein
MPNLRGTSGGNRLVQQVPDALLWLNHGNRKCPMLRGSLRLKSAPPSNGTRISSRPEADRRLESGEISEDCSGMVEAYQLSAKSSAWKTAGSRHGALPEFHGDALRSSQA